VVRVASCVDVFECVNVFPAIMLFERCEYGGWPWVGGRNVEGGVLAEPVSTWGAGTCPAEPSLCKLRRESVSVVVGNPSATKQASGKHVITI
jgi:hypothetical protein